MTYLRNQLALATYISFIVALTPFVDPLMQAVLARTGDVPLMVLFAGLMFYVGTRIRISSIFDLSSATVDGHEQAFPMLFLIVFTETLVLSHSATRVAVDLTLITAFVSLVDICERQFGWRTGAFLLLRPSNKPVAYPHWLRNLALGLVQNER